MKLKEAVESGYSLRYAQKQQVQAAAFCSRASPMAAASNSGNMTRKPSSSLAKRKTQAPSMNIGVIREFESHNQNSTGQVLHQPHQKQQQQQQQQQPQVLLELNRLGHNFHRSRSPFGNSQAEMKTGSRILVSPNPREYALTYNIVSQNQQQQNSQRFQGQENVFQSQHSEWNSQQSQYQSQLSSMSIANYASSMSQQSLLQMPQYPTNYKAVEPQVTFDGLATLVTTENISEFVSQQGNYAPKKQLNPQQQQSRIRFESKPHERDTTQLQFNTNHSRELNQYDEETSQNRNSQNRERNDIGSKCNDNWNSKTIAPKMLFRETARLLAGTTCESQQYFDEEATKQVQCIFTSIAKERQIIANDFAYLIRKASAINSVEQTEKQHQDAQVVQERLINKQEESISNKEIEQIQEIRCAACAERRKVNDDDEEVDGESEQNNTKQKEQSKKKIEESVTYQQMAAILVEMKFDPKKVLPQTSNVSSRQSLLDARTDCSSNEVTIDGYGSRISRNSSGSSNTNSNHSSSASADNDAQTESNQSSVLNEAVLNLEKAELNSEEIIRVQRMIIQQLIGKVDQAKAMNSMLLERLLPTAAINQQNEFTEK